MTNGSKNFYVGMTDDLERRVFEHKNRVFENSFTNRYTILRLVYYEEIEGCEESFERETQIKKWRREKKIKLIESLNPYWKDLSKGWYEDKWSEDLSALVEMVNG